MILKTFISEDRISGKIQELSRKIEDYIGDEEVILIANLKGSFLFFADLIRKIRSSHIMVDFISTVSYNNTESTGIIKITRDVSIELKGKKIIIIEDILDPGLTLDHLIRYIKDIHQPSDIKTCVLLDKPSRRKVQVGVDYVGFIIEDYFVVGYGLDYNGYGRNLEDIYSLIK